MKKRMIVLMSILFSLLVSGCSIKGEVVESTTEQALEKLPLTILTVNDLHGYIEQEEDGTSGLSNMAYLIDEIRASNAIDDVILIGNGDLFQGTSISNMTEGLAVLESMNKMEFDAMGIGNHEFDWEISTILEYFDGVESNGEANFPLLNANIYLNSDHSLLTVENGNVFDSVMVEREGVQIGIISYIGDVYSSIAYDKVDEFYFDLEIANSVKTISSGLKDDGADVIIVNIHGGYASNIEQYNYNRELALLKDEQGDYLVDAVINGHTHTVQKGAITREGGLEMPVIQAGGNGNHFGKITLEIDLDTMEVESTVYETINTDLAGTKHDEEIEKIIDDFKDELGNEVLATAGETVQYRNQLYDWVGNVMLAATGADIAVHNTGGIRSTGGVTKGEDITLSQMYEISPFDNTLWVIEATYDEVSQLLNSSSVFTSVKEGIDVNSDETFTVVVISYVYYWDQLEDVRSNQDRDTGLYIRDILVEDVRIKGLNGEAFSPIAHPEASLDLQ
jgi:2',3'-cyclic-nucleotide 2'-phosphodiesterase (5'-nucleotidase family)